MSSEKIAYEVYLHAFATGVTGREQPSYVNNVGEESLAAARALGLSHGSTRAAVMGKGDFTRLLKQMLDENGTLITPPVSPPEV